MNKSGTTILLPVDIGNVNVDDVGSALFTLEGLTTITMEYPGTVRYDGSLFLIPLTQEDTLSIAGDKGHMVYMEAQINFLDKSVSKTHIEQFFMEGTLKTTLIDGNTPSAVSLDKVVLKVHDGIIIAQIDDEQVDAAIDRLDNAVDDLKEKTDSGYFDGKDGKTPVKGVDYFDAIVIPSNGMFSMMIKNGHLNVLYNEINEPPSLFIDGDGHLIFGER